MAANRFTSKFSSTADFIMHMLNDDDIDDDIKLISETFGQVGMSVQAAVNLEQTQENILNAAEQIEQAYSDIVHDMTTIGNFVNKQIGQTYTGIVEGMKTISNFALNDIKRTALSSTVQNIFFTTTFTSQFVAVSGYPICFRNNRTDYSLICNDPFAMIDFMTPDVFASAKYLCGNITQLDASFCSFSDAVSQSYGRSFFNLPLCYLTTNESFSDMTSCLEAVLNNCSRFTDTDGVISGAVIVGGLVTLGCTLFAAKKICSSQPQQEGLDETAPIINAGRSSVQGRIF